MAGEIFISYRRADQAWARLLHAQLQAEGVEAWYDAQVGAGQDWRISTAKALKASQIFVLLFSSNAAQSTDIAKELAAAVFEKKLVIPVRLEDISPDGAFLYELASRNWVNAFEDTEAKLAELAKGLAHLVRTGARDESLLPFDHSDDSRKTSKRNWLSRPVVIAAATITVIAASSIGAWLLWPAKHWTVESNRPFISTLAPEDYPAFSPDGKMLAYTSGDTGARKIYVRNLAGGDGLKVTSDAYDDISPSWSSDGARLAYIAQKIDQPCRIMVVTIPAGEAREVGRCDQLLNSQVTWQPGTSYLYYKDRLTPNSSAIFRLDLDSGARLAITGKKRNDFFDDLNCSPDGKSLVYLQRGLAIDRLAVRDLDSGKEITLGQITRSLATEWPASAAWSEDSKTVLVAASGGSEIIAYPADGSAAYRVYATANLAGHLSVGSGGMLAVETDTGRRNLARASLTPAKQPDVIDAANGITFSPSFAPDGTLAFLSNRSGTNAVWTMKPGAAPTMLFDGGLLPLFIGEFSPDGSRLVVVYGSAHGVTYKVLTANGATVATFDMAGVGHGLPTWTPDSKALITMGGKDDSTLRIAIGNPEQRRPFAGARWEAVVVHGNSTLAVRHDRPNTLWRIDDGEKLFSSKYSDEYLPPITFRGDDVLIPDFNAEGGPRILAQPLAGGPDRVIAYAPGAENNGYLGKLAVNPKTGEIIYVASVSRDTNIDLLTLSRH